MNGKSTPGPWVLSKIGFRTNDGAAPVMAPDPDLGEKRVALVDCQTRFKRGQGWKAECAEREANARLIAAAPELLEALVYLVGESDDSMDAEYNPHAAPLAKARAAIAKASLTHEG